MIPSTVRPQRNVLRDAAIIFGVAWFVIGWFVLRYDFDFLTDARAYFDGSLHPYDGVIGTKGVFGYTPPLAQLFASLSFIPRTVALSTWFVLNVAAVVWLLRGQWLVGLMLAMPISDALATGQIEILMTVAIVSMRPAGWVLPILAKSTTGIGLLWFVVRREWRNLCIALGLLGAIAVGSFILSPSLWADWLRFITLHATTAGQALPVRLGIAGVVVVWGARTDRPWVLPIVALLALPVLYIHSLVMLVGVGALRRGRVPALTEQRAEPVQVAGVLAADHVG